MLIILIIILVIIKLFFEKYDNFNNIDNNNLEFKYPIKNVKPELVLNVNSNICFIFFYTKNIADYAKHSLKNITKYCEKHNYALQCFNEKFNDDVHPCWNKVASILKLIKKYNYIVWIDCDAIFVHHEKRIEDFINKDDSKDLHICFDIVKDKHCINSGVFIIKNTDWSYNLLKKVWNSNSNHGYNDQNILLDEILKEAHPNDTINEGIYITDENNNVDYKYKKYCYKELHPKICMHDEKEFNTHIFNYNKGDFVIHLMGLGTNSRIKVMRQINTLLGLDNYEDNNCILLINNNVNSSDRNKIIRKICYTEDDNEFHKTD